MRQNDYIKIQSGETVGISIIEVKSIPHVSTLSEDRNAQSANDHAVAENRKDMSNLLVEAYQLYKESFRHKSNTPDMSFEVIWLTQPVENQPYKANVSLYLILRTIQSDTQVVDSVLSALLNLCATTLDLSRYTYKLCDFDEYFSKYNSISKTNIRAIIKEERIEDLHNNMYPVCYSFDQFSLDESDLSRIANVLINSPYTAVSFSLIPTYYTNEERGEIGLVAQNLSTLRRGVSERHIGVVSLQAADHVSSLYGYYAENKDRPLFLYNILIYSDQASISSVSTRVLGQLNTSQDASINLHFVDLSEKVVCANRNMLYPQPWVVNENIMKNCRNYNVWNSGLISQNLFRLPFVITADEASCFFRFPIANEKISAGFIVDETSKSSRTYSQNIINSGDIEIGVLKSTALKDSIGLSLKDLAKHMLVVGTPGSGKTTFSVGLLDRLWKEHKIPFLVIEPAKNEYRALVQSIPELQVFTPGKNFISPFVYNPFIPPKNVKLETYKSTLKTAFAAGVSMSTPLDKIFEESINNCYSDFRWLDSYTIDDNGKIFNISDFIKCFQATFDAIGYTGDARNIGRAGVVRLKSLMNLFDNYFSIPIEDLLTKPTIIELAAIENSDQKALIISLLLLSILAYVNANYVGEGGLRNFILLEEAHVLLDSSSNAGDGSANPAAIAQGLVKRMLAEIRSYGVGLAIADQSPRKVGIDIVALTDIKVAFRLVESQDKQILADSTNMNEVQLSRLAKLKPGEAYLFFNKLDEPEEVVTPDYRLANNISISLSDEGIKSLSTYWNDKQEKLRPYPECELNPYCTHSCVYNRRLLAREVSRRIFNRHFDKNATFETIKRVFANISNLIIAELNNETFDRELLSCVKTYLWRKIKYETNIQVMPKTIEISLSKL